MQNYFLPSPSRTPPILYKTYSLAILKRRIFVHGGKYYMRILLDEFWQYDIHLKSWLIINKDDNMPIRSKSSEIIVVNNCLYLIGYEHSPFNDRQISVRRFDSEKNTWGFLTNLQGTHENYNYSLDSVQSMFYYNNSLYVIAVTQRDQSCNIILQYSLMERYWSVVQQIGELLKVMEGISGSVFDNKYYCFGDMIKFTRNIYREIHIFDLKTYVWSHKATYPDFDEYPSDRIHASMSFNETHGFLIAGKSESQDILDDIWSIDLRTLKWHKFNFVSVSYNENIESKIFKHKSVIYDKSTLFIFGGIIDNDIAKQLQMYVLEPPPLYKLCLYIIMKSNKEASDLKIIPQCIRQDIIAPQGEFLVSQETNSNTKE